MSVSKIYDFDCPQGMECKRCIHNGCGYSKNYNGNYNSNYNTHSLLYVYQLKESVEKEITDIWKEGWWILKKTKVKKTIKEFTKYSYNRHLQITSIYCNLYQKIVGKKWEEVKGKGNGLVEEYYGNRHNQYITEDEYSKLKEEFMKIDVTPIGCV